MRNYQAIKLTASLIEHISKILALHVLPLSNNIISFSQTELKIWDSYTFQCIFTYKRVTAISESHESHKSHESHESQKQVLGMNRMNRMNR